MYNHLLQAIESKTFSTGRFLYTYIEFDWLQWDSAGVLDYDGRQRRKSEHIILTDLKCRKKNPFRSMIKVF